MTIDLTKLDAESIGRPIMVDILNAHLANDYEMLTKHCSNQLKQSLTPDQFTQAVDNLRPMGKALSIEYLGYLNRVNEGQLLWKIRYENAKEDLLWQLYLSEIDSEIRVVGLWFS